MRKQKKQIIKKDKSYRGVDEDIHNEFVAYCNHNGKNTGDTLSEALSDYLKKYKK